MLPQTWLQIQILIIGCTRLISGYTEADRRECGSYTFGIVTCQSVNFFYKECPVPEAEEIHLIKLHEGHTSATCLFKSTFGFRQTAVWVTEGCSGTFYLCYTGDPQQSTDRPAVTIPPDRGTNPTPVASASTGSDNNVLIYIIVASSVVVLVGIGLLVGCCVKRRQQNETSRHLAEKRQIRIALREHMEDREENGVSALPLATRSLSVDSLNGCEFENEGSESSVRTSISGMTSVSAQDHSNYGQKRSSVSFAPGGRLKKGYSTPDIHELGRMFCQANMLNRQPKNSILRSSQSSLSSIREVCDKYQMFDIPLEKRIKQQNNARTVKFNTVGHSLGNRSGSLHRIGTQVLPRGRTVTRALVHTSSANRNGQISRSSSIRSVRSNRTSVGDYEPETLSVYDHPILSDVRRPTGRDSPIVYESNEASSSETRPSSPLRNPPISMISGQSVSNHYHDPDSLRIRQEISEARKGYHESQRLANPLGRQSPTPSTSSVYSQPTKPKPKILPKPVLAHNNINYNNATIYATVNKSMFKAASKVPWGTPPDPPKVNRIQSLELKTVAYVEPYPKSNGNDDRPNSPPLSTGYKPTARVNASSPQKIDNSITHCQYTEPVSLQNAAYTHEITYDAPILQKPKDQPSDSRSIYSSIETDGNCDLGIDNAGYRKSRDLYDLEDDEEDVRASDRDSTYAHLATFKPAVTSPIFIHGFTRTISNI